MVLLVWHRFMCFGIILILVIKLSCICRYIVFWSFFLAYRLVHPASPKSSFQPRDSENETETQAIRLNRFNFWFDSTLFLLLQFIVIIINHNFERPAPACNRLLNQIIRKITVIIYFKQSNKQRVPISSTTTLYIISTIHFFSNAF